MVRRLLQDMRVTVAELVRRAASLRRQILVLAGLMVAADVLAADECIRMLGHSTTRMAIGLASALAAVVTISLWGLRLERERGDCLRAVAVEIARG